jgi:hypothetical protein
MFLLDLRLLPRLGLVSSFGIETLLNGFVIAALALRLTWARPIVLGGIGCCLVQVAFSLLVARQPQPLWLLPHLGVLAFVMPWRRSELTASGVALALQVWAFGVAAFALQFQVSTRAGFYIPTIGAIVAYFATIIATCGGILRARWGALASYVSAIGLALAFFQMESLRFTFWDDARPLILAHVASAAVAAFAGAVLAWRNARSTLGTFEQVLA